MTNHHNKMQNLNYIADAVHNKGELHLSLPDYISEVIDSAEFQRLKKIKQLGFVYKQDERATYSCYEHSIGVYILTENLLSSLEKNTGGLKIPEVYHVCICFAALLRNVGCGPFSNFWHFKNVSNQENSGICFEKIWNNLNFFNFYENKALFFQRKFEIKGIIKALILGREKTINIPDNISIIPEEFEFIYEIVNNEESRLDVTKLDLLLRDNYYVGKYCEGLYFDRKILQSIFDDAKISKDRKHVEFKYEDFGKIHYLTLMNKSFHKRIYKTPEVIFNEHLIRESINWSNEKPEFFNGKDIYTIDGSDPDFLNLTDEKVLCNLNDMKLEEVQEYMKYFQEQRFYKIPNHQNLEEPFPIEVNIDAAIKTMSPEKIHFYIGPNHSTLRDENYNTRYLFRTY